MCFLLVIAGTLASCDDPKKRALRELTQAGIEPTGQSLIEAVGRKDTVLIGSLLAAGVHTEKKDEQGRTSLRMCVDAGDAATALALLEGGADANTAAADGSTLLGAAVARMDPAFVLRLLDAGAKPDGTMPGGEKVLPWAIREGRDEIVRSVMKASPDPHVKDREGSPLLHVAMKAGRRDLVDEFIRLGADPGQMNARGETTLHAAIRNGWFDVIPSLVKAGADPNLPGPFSPSPLSQAVIDGNLRLITLLLKAGADPNYQHPLEDAAADGVAAKTPLELAFFHSDRRVFQIFVDRKVKFGQSRVDTWFAAALEKRDLDLMRLLLSRGASPALRRSDGWLPIEAAVLAGDSTLVKLLSDYGSPDGRSMHLAAGRGDHRMARFLIFLGMNPDIVHPPYLDRPLSVAIRRHHDATAAALIEAGAKMVFRMPEGQTPLHLAVATGCPLTVRTLLENGADPNTPFELPASAAFTRQVRPGIMRWALKMDRNVTLLMVAADSGDTATARHLIHFGAKKDTWARVSSLWPINFASRRGDVKMMRLILGKDPHAEERRIVINLGEQRARMFDAQGTEIFNTKVSTGRKGFATPPGEYVITNKHRDWTSTIYHASMPYFQRLSCSDFGLHAGVVPGYPASHGCIRVPAGNAAKLFAMTEAGDRVMIVP